jgi:hypothetical protein
VLVLVAAVLSLALMRLGSSRESSRRIGCEDNLRAVFLAMETYSLQNGAFPIGTQNPNSPIRSEADGYHHNWISGILPQLNRQPLYEAIDFDYGVYAEQNAAIAKADLPQLRCPAAEQSIPSHATCYAGVTSSLETPIDEVNDGMFLLNTALSPDDAEDGASYVFLIGEKSIEYAGPSQWNSGTRTSLRNTGHPLNARTKTGELKSQAESDPLFVGGFSSHHVGGAYFLTVGGEFRFFAEATDTKLLQQFASRADGEQADTE